MRDDEPLLKPFRKPLSPRQPKRAETLFVFYCEWDHARWICELRNHDHYGVEVQFWKNDEFSHAVRFDTRERAMQWAEDERKAIEKGDE